MSNVTFNPFDSQLLLIPAGGISAVGTFGSVPNSGGASISGSTIILQPANATNPGGITTGSQTIAGQKTFSTGITGTLTGHASLDVATSSLGNLTDVGTDGIVITGGTGATVGNVSVAQHVADATHNGYLSSTDWSTFNNKQTAGNYITDLTGDGTASGPGSAALTLATVNASPGATTISSVTTNAKGLVTSNTSATTTGTGSTVVLATAPTMTNPVVGTQTATDNSTKAASTAYVTTAINNAQLAFNPAIAVQAATTAASDTSGLIYNNGVAGVGATFTGSNNTALTVDGYTFTAVNQRLLVKNDTQSPSGAFNGIYYVTQIQALGLPPILTRALDYNTPSTMNNTGAIPVINGTANSTTSWVLTSQVTTVGTDPLTFVEFTRNPADYLLKTNNLSDVSSKSTSFNNLSPMTTLGDVIIGGSSGTGTRLGVGTRYQTLQATATTVAYDAVHLDQAAAVTGVLPNGNTTAASANTASAIVTRDSSGNFIAGTITAALTGTASGNTTYTANNHGVVLSSATNAMTVLAPDSSTSKVLKSGGSSADPSWTVFIAPSSGDISETSFSIANNQSSAANVTNFTFANGTVRSFQALVSVYINATSSLYESFTLQGIQRGSDWMMSTTSVGDNSSVVFSITAAGAIQYTSANYSGFSAGTCKFRAITVSV
jgi:hypothetical protein